MKCKRCGRKLKIDNPKHEGYGPVCYKKHIAELNSVPERFKYIFKIKE